MIHQLGGFLAMALGISGGILLCWFAWLGFRQARQTQVIQQFRKALTILINTMSEGRTFETAIAVLADLGPKPLNREFRNLDALAKRGENRPAILAELIRRFPCFEAEYLATALECFPDRPQVVAGRLAKIKERRDKRESSRNAIVSACRATRLWIRGLLLASPLAIAAIAVWRPEVFQDFRARMGSSSSVLMLIGGMFIVAVWFVLILQKQDESEIVFD